MAASKKSTARKKTTPRSRKPVRKTASKAPIDRIEAELPDELRDFSRRVRRDLSRLEREIENTRKDARRRATRVLREVSHELGRLEAHGERRWKTLTAQARRDAVKVLQKLEKAIAPPKRKPSRKKAAKKKAPVSAAS